MISQTFIQPRWSPRISAVAVHLFTVVLAFTTIALAVVARSSENQFLAQTNTTLNKLHEYLLQGGDAGAVKTQKVFAYINMSRSVANQTFTGTGYLFDGLTLLAAAIILIAFIGLYFSVRRLPKKEPPACCG